MTTQFDINALAAPSQRGGGGRNPPALPRARPTATVRTKTSAIDLVTEADEAAERFIKAGMEAVLPGALFIGEESVAAEPTLLAETGARPTLPSIVDPIDGTFNFAAGVPLFGVMAAVVSGGETIAGVIYDPMGDDFVLAEKGAGAWQTGGDRPAVRLKAAGAGCARGDDRHGLDRLPAGREAGARDGQSRQGRLLLELPLRGARIPHLRRRAPALSDVQQADALGPSRRHADQPGGRRLCRPLRRLRPIEPRHVEGGLLLAPDRESWDMMRREIFVD